MRTTKKTIDRQSGFTLVELLLYLAITSIMIVVISAFIQAMYEARVKSQTISEVEHQGQLVMNTIGQSLRNATGVTTPAANGTTGTACPTATTANALVLTVRTAANSPTTFDLSSGVLRMKEGAAAAVNLTNSKVAVCGLIVDDLTVSGQARSVQVKFTITDSSTSLKNEYTYSKDFEIAGTLAQ
jgi:Tfp pilus assembly protein PilW